MALAFERSSAEQDKQEDENYDVKLWEREETPLLKIPLPSTNNTTSNPQPVLPPKILLLRQFGSDATEFGIHSCVWDSGIALLHFLAERYNIDGSAYKQLSSSNSTLVVDLGAGTGVVGLGTSIILGCHAVLTDLPEALDLLQQNIVLNEKELIKDRIVALELSWGGTSLPTSLVEMIKSSEYVIVVGADIVYQQSLFDPLLKSIRQLFECRPDIEFFLGSQSIRTHLKEFYIRAEAAGFQLSVQAKVVVPEGLPDINEVMKPIVTLGEADSPLHTNKGTRNKPSIVEIVKVSSVC